MLLAAIFVGSGFDNGTGNPQGIMGIQHYEKGPMWEGTYLSGHMQPQFQEAGLISCDEDMSQETKQMFELLNLRTLRLPPLQVLPMNYIIARIPTNSSRLPELVAKFRDAKLEALEAEPTGFAVKYADEVLHPLSLWQQRLTSPSIILICVAKSDTSIPNTEEEALIAGDWIGMVTIRGPLPYSTFQLPESGQPVPDNPNGETRWHLSNLYTSQVHRGKGLGKKLVISALDIAREQARMLDKMRARIRLFCNPSKTVLVTMYKGMGFEEAGKCTLKEAFVANGDQELVPRDTQSTDALRGFWERRYGLAMEQVLDA
ncbi:uncharacterized protein BDR25DRAFT_391219 [Lindgomyces ingoldianus]|uniref:Uncharacterized protein n=1 Tax=Lindgomyces ingoldianus TaxID=673940 RepID=A0ACB6RB25_9PLEO|nr:uncharacterized protein BDR25DRAFT_391219 [Lindgomyces ingoldianus]KAF2475722.1 hypothetical protein BDR25DRAFT_391219 [Lindgomyces ingoldianus]